MVHSPPQSAFRLDDFCSAVLETRVRCDSEFKVGASVVRGLHLVLHSGHHANTAYGRRGWWRLCLRNKQTLVFLMTSYCAHYDANKLHVSSPVLAAGYSFPFCAQFHVTIQTNDTTHSAWTILCTGSRCIQPLRWMCVFVGRD